jgi:orotidine-5'-phosphate decarboxylase
MKYQELVSEINRKRSLLCVGLDTDLSKIPIHLLDEKDPVFEFNKVIIDSTANYSVAFKPNLAFYESLGLSGWKSLEKTIDYINEKYPEILTIADAKRGDIGNTSKMYAKAFFEKLKFDAVTVAPYMGKDSVAPFLEYDNKWVIVLGLTSNQGAFDFQFTPNAETNTNLFEDVISKSSEWGTKENMMYVVGATKAEMLQDVRKIVPDHFLLVPGVGAQGGSLDEVVKNGANKDKGLIINSSRGIIYADKTERFGLVSELKALELQNEMSSYF